MHGYTDRFSVLLSRGRASECFMSWSEDADGQMGRIQSWWGQKGAEDGGGSVERTDW